MTIEERIDRIEHYTAGLDDQWRRQREEDRQLWRDTQRQINEVTSRLNDLTVKMDRMAEESRAADLRARAADLRARAAEQELRDRIDALVSAMGQWIARGNSPEPKPGN